ncbi:phage tail tape measure protein [Methylobacter sp. Wu8]|uniref:phage tail tape measure protein n=1 Tax=Methylobacter sp. Wu8 TaxID=3118457 RepID=UPI002F2FD33D
MTALNNLLFKVSLLDAMSGPAKGMMSTMDRVTTKIQGGFNKIGYGAAGLTGAAYSLDSILQPAKEMQSALGEISSLGVGQQVLDGLNSRALKFSAQYGESAAEFVHASYDIQSAISGLAGNELAQFTNASAILAKGTKADMATVTDYVGTMYGIFQQNADAMGKADWINMMAGQTAVAVNIFKTTGQGMSEAFTTLGAGAQTMGVGMAEQMAIMGTLQATMSGSEAGTKYRAFLKGVGHAQKELNLQFTDSHGMMLPMVEILDRIKGKYGAIDTVAKSDLLQKAFGSDEGVALVKLLSTNIDGLSGSIAKVGEQTGLQGAIDMAKAMTMPWEQAKSSGNALTIMLGQRMLPVLNPVFNGISGISEKLMRWMDLFPNITRYIGYAVFAVIGIIAALSALSVAVGISQFLLVGWGAGAAVFKGALWLLKGGLFNVIPAVWSFSAALLANPITWIVLGIGALIGVIAAAIIYWDTWTQAVVDWSSAWLESTGVFAWVDSVVAFFERIPQWWNSFTIWIGTLNPFALVGTGIGLIVANFDTITQWWTWFTGWIGTLNPFALVGAGIGLIVANFDTITQWWTWFTGWIGTLNPFALVGTGVGLIVADFDVIKNWWSEFKIWLSTLNPFAGISSAADSLMRGIQSITGAKINMAAAPAAQPAALDKLYAHSAINAPQTASPSLSAMAAQPKWTQQPAPGLLMDGFTPPKPVAAPAALTQSQTANVPKGGIMSQINNADNSKSVSVGGITVNNYGQPVTGQRLADEIAMAAG